jgi:hypothetical protein
VISPTPLRAVPIVRPQVVGQIEGKDVSRPVEVCDSPGIRAIGTRRRVLVDPMPFDSIPVVQVGGPSKVLDSLRVEQILAKRHDR